MTLAGRDDLSAKKRCGIKTRGLCKWRRLHVNAPTPQLACHPEARRSWFCKANC